MRRVQILLALLASTVLLYGQDVEPTDQPGQAVARIGIINGEASVRRGDSGEWVAAVLNAPLLAGDSIAVGPGGSVEMQIDYANFVRIGGDSEIRISQMENGRNQIQVSRGLVTWRVLRDVQGNQSEISTPGAAVHPLRLSSVRTEVTADGSTRVIVRRGDAEVSNSRGTEVVHEGNMMLLRGTPGDSEYQVVYAPARDGWDTWNDQRDTFLERAQSPRYVSQDISGAEDLDQYGRWGYDPAYGNVWTPSVADTWAPYRNGQWVWADYYGWTWVDAAPWGWAPFHYGSWYMRAGYGWTWFPGARTGRVWWRPAMVGFFGFGGGFGVGVGFGNVGWVPLAPFEVFHPWYGRGWNGGGRYGAFTNVNIVRNTNVINVYRNARFNNGVTAVSTQDFQRGVFRNPVAVSQNQLQQASVARGGVPVSPTANNMRFSERPAATAAIPRNEIANQRFFSRTSANGFAQPAPLSQPQTGNSGWRRFGEPSQAPGVQTNGFQAGGYPRANANPSPNTGSGSAAGWDRFGSPQPQRFAAPAQQQPSRPAYNYGSRSVPVAPPIVQQRQAPSGGGFRSAPPPPRGPAGGGGRPSSAGGGRQSSGSRR